METHKSGSCPCGSSISGIPSCAPTQGDIGVYYVSGERYSGISLPSRAVKVMIGSRKDSQPLVFTQQNSVSTTDAPTKNSNVSSQPTPMQNGNAPPPPPMPNGNVPPPPPPMQNLNAPPPPPMPNENAAPPPPPMQTVTVPPLMVNRNVPPPIQNITPPSSSHAPPCPSNLVVPPDSSNADLPPPVRKRNEMPHSEVTKPKPIETIPPEPMDLMSQLQSALKKKAEKPTVDYSSKPNMQTRRGPVSGQDQGVENKKMFELALQKIRPAIEGSGDDDDLDEDEHDSADWNP